MKSSNFLIAERNPKYFLSKKLIRLGDANHTYLRHPPYIYIHTEFRHFPNFAMSLILYTEYLCKYDNLSSSIWCVGSTGVNTRFENNPSVSNAYKYIYIYT